MTTLRELPASGQRCQDCEMLIYERPAGGWSHNVTQEQFARACLERGVSVLHEARP